jgi:hypothetical protein
MTAPNINQLVLEDWRDRNVVRVVDSDWYDGPMSGVFEVDNPLEEFSFETYAIRVNPNGLDLRFASARLVPLGTALALERGENTGIPSPGSGVFDGSGEHFWHFDFAPPLQPGTLFLAFASGRRILAAWRAETPVLPPREAAEQLLAAVEFEN